MALYQNGANSSISFDEMISYIWLQQAFYAFISIRGLDSEISKSIRSGSVAYEIIRPYNLYFWWYIKLVAKRIANGLMRVLPVITIAVLLPWNYGIRPPHTLLNFLLFVVSLGLGLFVVVGINMLIHTIGFYTYNEDGISSMLISTMELLCGGYIPVVLLPMIIQKATYYLPFRLVSDLPFRIYSNNIGIHEGLMAIGLQLIWIVVLIFIGNMIVKRALNKVFIQGG